MERGIRGSVVGLVLVILAAPSGAGLGPILRWVTTSHADWATGTLVDVDIESTPGDLTLPRFEDEFPEAPVSSAWDVELRGGRVYVEDGAMHLAAGSGYPEVRSPVVLPRLGYFHVLIDFRFETPGDAPVGLGIGASGDDAPARLERVGSVFRLALFDAEVDRPADEGAHRFEARWNGDLYTIWLDGALLLAHDSREPVAETQRRVWMGGPETCCAATAPTLRVDRVLARGLTGSYDSRILDVGVVPGAPVGNPAVLLAVEYDAVRPADATMLVMLRGSLDGQTWGFWVPFESGETPSDGWAYRFYQFRVTFEAETAFPVVRSIEFDLAPDLTPP